jgi:hypothetical protein
MRYPDMLKKWYGHKVIQRCDWDAIGHDSDEVALKDFHSSVDSISEPLSI